MVRARREAGSLFLGAWHNPPIMSERLSYQVDAYLRQVSTTVENVGELEGRPYAVLADSVLYPEGGGQPADRGRLAGVDVVDVQKIDGAAFHFLTSAVDAGRATVELDWQRRYDHMQQHTAQHLLSAIAATEFGWETTSFHLGTARSDVELNATELEPSAIARLEERVIEEIRAARPTSARWLTSSEYNELDIRSRGLPADFEGEVRLVEIEGVDLTTCGGTHLRSTAEIETIQLGDTEPMRGGTRLHWVAGGRVRKRLETLEVRNRELRSLLETSGDELAGALAAKLESLRGVTRELKQAHQELATARATSLALAPGRLAEVHVDGVDGGFLQHMAREVIAQAPEKVALVTSSNDKGHFFCIVTGNQTELDLAATGGRVAELLEGRGGGSKGQFQGKAASLARRGEAVSLLETLLQDD